MADQDDHLECFTAHDRRAFQFHCKLNQHLTTNLSSTMTQQHFKESPPTTLIMAVQCEDTTIVRKLLSTSCSEINVGGWLSRTPLHHAAIRGLIGTVKNLLRHGALVHCRDSNGMIALHLACVFGWTKVAQMLLKHDHAHNALVTSIDTQDYTGMTPLAYASMFDHAAVVKLLLKNGANHQLTDHHDNTVLLHARHNGSAAAAKVLVRAGAVIINMQPLFVVPVERPMWDPELQPAAPAC